MGELVGEVFVTRMRKGYQKLLVENGSTMNVDKLPMQKEYDELLEGDKDNKK